YKTADLGSGLWGAGGVVIDDATGNVFGATGNGVAGGCATTGQNDAVVRLSPTLSLLDWFSPQDWQATWCQPDQDLGSAGPVLLSPNLMFQSGKAGGGFLLNPNNLGHVNGQAFPSPTNYAQAEVCFGNHSDATFGSFAYAAPFVYVECEGRGIVALNVITAGPDASSWGSTRTDVFVRGTDNGLWYRTWNGTSWGGWVSLGGIITADPSAVSWGPNRIDVFVRGTDNALWHRSSDGTTWSGWENLGGILTSAPDAALCGAGHLDVFMVGTGQGIWQRGFNGTAWGGWNALRGQFTVDPGAVCPSGTTTVQLFERGPDGSLLQSSAPGT